ncbi:MAG: hypothetical protein LBI19_08125 [Oscillospiraceae bacterium]|jgi:hypothetical protein|nr:hypothetical protein [Oscillospiraceae bacterium]
MKKAVYLLLTLFLLASCTPQLDAILGEDVTPSQSPELSADSSAEPPPVEPSIEETPEPSLEPSIDPIPSIEPSPEATPEPSPIAELSPEPIQEPSPSPTPVKSKSTGGTYKDENMQIVTSLSEIDKFSVFWGHTGDKVHINPDCRSFKNGVLFGTLDDGKAAGRTEGWCGYSDCSKGETDDAFRERGNKHIRD